MKPAKRSSLIALFCVFCGMLPAQSILLSYTKCDSLFVCNTDTFTVKVQNNFNALLSGALLNLDLPPGLTYVSSSVQGAGEQNISNLASPVYALPNVPAGQSITVKLILSADCAAADVLDAGQLFIAQLSLNSALGNAQISTTSIPVETGAIVITSVTPSVMVGERFDTLFRTICVKNTRLGKIRNLHLEDSHLDGLEIQITGATTQSGTNTLYTADFDGNFFTSVGNGDTWLDLNESICFTERIIITSCGIPEITNGSLLRVGWGCGGDECRYDSSTAYVQIQKSTKVPNLVFEPIWAPPTDYCGQIPAVMGFKINNTGLVDAKDVIMNFTLTQGLTQVAMRSNSFRAVYHNTIIPVTPNLTTPTVLPACNLLAEREASFVYPLIPANDSILFLFDVLTCVNKCEQVLPAFRVDYFYKKDCPVNGFVSGNELILPEGKYKVQGKLYSSIGECLQSVQSYPFSYKGISKYLLEPGFWHLELDFPPGITLDPSCGVLLGNAPPVLMETSPLPGFGQKLHLAWATPFSLDSVEMHFCLHYECDTNIVCLDPVTNPNGGVIFTDICCAVQLSDITYWSPSLQTDPVCAINDCHEKLLAIDYSCDPGEGDPPLIGTSDPAIETPGLRSWWNVYRTNLDFQDNDDDRHADLPLSSANGTLSRRDRFLAGDTLRVEYCGVMDSAASVDTISRAIWHEILASDMGTNDNDFFQTQLAKDGFADSSKFRLLNTIIRVRYADGTEVLCDWDGLIYAKDRNYFQVVKPNTFPPEAIDEIATEKFYFLYPLPTMFASGCLPKPTLELGDSIFIINDFKIDLNFKPSSTNNPDPPLVGFQTATSPYGYVYAWNIKPRKKLQYSGWKKQFAPNTHSIKPCEPSSEVKRFRYSMRIARENMFPFEVRPLSWISDYHQTTPFGLQLATARLEYLTLQDSVSFLSNLPLPFAQSANSLDIDFAPAFAAPVDEGYTLRTNLSFQPNCRFSLPDTSIQYIETRFNHCLNGATMSVLDSIKNPIGFYSNTPDLRLLTGDSIVHSPTRAFELNFALKDILVSSAPAAWVAVVSPSGQSSDFELFQMPQNQALTGVNGLFNLGNINGFSTRNLRLKGNLRSCETDTLLLIYGWGCAPISSLSDSDCGRDTFRIILYLERPELELDILQEPDEITLCAPSDWFEFEVYNAKIGYAYALEASVKLPAGMSIVPGSCQISYPEGSLWTNIANPTALTGNLFQWEINDLLPILQANGLPGVNLNPANSFHIRFKTLAECGYVANTPIIYGTTGIEPCGRQANVLNKPGKPLNIMGVNPSYGVQLSLLPQGNPGVACSTSQAFSVNMNILGTPSAGDSVYVILPQGVTLVLNSYSPGLNAPVGPVDLNAQGFQLALPLLQGGGIVQFAFQVDYGALAGCNDQILLAQTRVHTEAFCQSQGAPCTVYISTGEASWNIHPAHPQLSASDLQLSISNGLLNGNLTVSNIGTLAANGTLVQIWRDINGNGTPDSGDLLLATLQDNTLLQPGATVQMSGAISGLDSTLLCDLMLVLPAEENCACDDQVLLLNHLELKHTELNYCALQTVIVGVPGQAGATYNWQPITGLLCPTCPNTTYTPGAAALNLLQLTETQGNCVITHQFQLTFGTPAEAQADNAVICAGESTTLHALPDGAGYIWQGPGLTNANQQNPVVQPSGNSTYSVTITFSNGCTATDTARITVLASDTMLLAGLSTCAGEAVSVLGTLTATAGVYQLVLPKSNGCDSILVQALTVLPKPQTIEERVLCHGDRLIVYDSLFVGSGQICKVFPSAQGCDSTHCVQVIVKDPPVFGVQDTIYGTYGQIITLTGPGGFVTYHWQPAPEPPCFNCPSVTYPADSAGYQEYLLTLAGADGCPGDILFRVFIFPPCSADSLRIPNAFTPNGDGSNDVFRVVAHEGSEVVSGLEIYDRWGEKVYEKDGNAFWDGTIDGNPAPSDVYVYIVKVSCGEFVGKRVGDVTLLR